MQYFNTFILSIIYINILFSSLIISRYLIGKLAQATRYTNIKQYQITNWYLTLFCALFYISFPLVGLFCLRFSNLNRQLDLKIVYHEIRSIILESLNISYVYTIFGITLSLIFLLNIALILTFSYKSLHNQIYNLYLFLRFNPQDRDSGALAKITDKLSNFFNTDIVSFSIIKFTNYLNERWAYHKCHLKWDKDPDISVRLSPEYKNTRKIITEYNKNRPWYNLHVILMNLMGNKYYNQLILISPLIIILYDCIFNNQIIIHVYYYLAIYMPIILLKKITYFFSQQNTVIANLIWDMVYKKESCIYALPKDHRKLFDVYIANSIKSVDLGPDALMDFDNSWFIYKSAKFTYNEKENLYYNGGDRSLKLLADKRLVYQYTDYDTQQEVEEEWYLIAVKYHYTHDNHYDIIVSIDTTYDAKVDPKY